jgi:hypothetical protein
MSKSNYEDLLLKYHELKTVVTQQTNLLAGIIDVLAAIHKTNNLRATQHRTNEKGKS